MSKRIISFLLLCTMLTSLAACGEAQTETTDTTDAAGETVVETEEVISDNLPEKDFGGMTSLTQWT